MNIIATCSRQPWNKGKLVGQKARKRMANTPTELQYLGRWCPRILSGRDHPYRQDFHAPTQLLPQTI